MNSASLSAIATVKPVIGRLKSAQQALESVAMLKDELPPNRQSANVSAAPSIASISAYAKSRSRRWLWASLCISAFVIGSAIYISGVGPFGIATSLPTEPISKTAEKRGDETHTGQKGSKSFKLSDAQWKTVGVETTLEDSFRQTLVTDGKITIDEEHTTPVFSPYAGRITKLFVKPGDKVEKGDPLFTVEATDMVQGQNDFMQAVANRDKAMRALDLYAVKLKRAKDLVSGNAMARKDLEDTELSHAGAVNDLKSGEVALEAARNRLRILGKSDTEIEAIEKGGKLISPATVVPSPLSGTVVLRKVGPGQLVGSASSEPVFQIGDLSTVWIVANVRESDATKVEVGQPLNFSILALPDQSFNTTITYLSASVSPDTRRLQVRGEIANPQGLLRPEMFATVSIGIGQEQRSSSVSRQSVLYEGDVARVWLVRDDLSIELRQIKPGILMGYKVQVLAGLKPGDRIVSRGALFIDRVAGPAVSDVD